MRGLGVVLRLALLSAGAGGKKRAWEQLCAALDPECRVPHHLRTSRAKFVAPPGSPPGHLKPVGSREFEGAWDGEVDVLASEEMTPHKFWTDYWPRKPFVLRGAAKAHKAFKLWKRDGYITKKYGHLKVKVEKKNEDRLTDYCGMRKFGGVVECGDSVEPYTETFINISRFMKNYRNTAFNHYVITQMPSGMADEVEVVPGWNCGKRPAAERKHRPELQGKPWLTQLYEANLWISYNEGLNFSSSVIHYDMNHQMMCVYDGEKEWILWDTWNEVDRIPMWSGYFDQRTGQAPGGSDDSPVDPERVDLERFPRFAAARWTNATMLPGDCMYLPAHLLHYVRSWGRNVAGMYMFQTSERYDPAHCGEAPKGGTPLSDYDLLWDFPGEEGRAGYNRVKMGYPHWKRHFRKKLVRAARGGEVALKDFMSFGRDSGLQPEFLRSAWAEAGLGGRGAAPVATIYSHAAFDDVFRRIGCGEEDGEDGGQMLDTEMARTSLTAEGQKQYRYTDDRGGEGGEEL